MSPDDIDPAERMLVAPHFDRSFYLAGNPDVAALDMDPLAHFLSIGWREGRNPHALFDVGYYLRVNTDVASSGLNPYLHYIVQGRTEGRLARRPLDARRRVLQASAPPRLRAADWHGAADLSGPIDAASVAGALRGACEAGACQAGALVVSLSHDDYGLHFGGVQNLIGDEERALGGSGAAYMHLSPAAPLPLLANPQAADEFRVRIRLNGQALGVAVVADVMTALAGVQRSGAPVELVIHHLMGWAPEVVTQLATGLQTRPTVWVHDFFSICPSYSLMRNDVVFCHAPPLQSTACGVCCYGADRARHAVRMRAFFAAVEPFVLAPSDNALAFWRDHAGLPHAGAAVVPLAQLLLAPLLPGEAAGDGVPPDPSPALPLRVAFLGARLMHKGWTVFEDLALSFADDARYAFYHLGVDHFTTLPGCVRNIPVRVTADRREAMIEAIAERAIDVVVNWSLWPETFCFAAYEAMAGGAFVLARAEAGNVWPAVREHAPGRGAPVGSAAALNALFASGAILRMAAEAPRVRGALLPSRGTAAWLLRGRTRLTEPAAHRTTAGADA